MLETMKNIIKMGDWEHWEMSSLLTCPSTCKMYSPAPPHSRTLTTVFSPLHSHSTSPVIWNTYWRGNTLTICFSIYSSLFNSLTSLTWKLFYRNYHFRFRGFRTLSPSSVSITSSSSSSPCPHLAFCLGESKSTQPCPHSHKWSPSQWMTD